MNPIYFYVILLIVQAILNDLKLTSAADIATRCCYWVGWWAIVWTIVCVFAIIGKAGEK